MQYQGLLEDFNNIRVTQDYVVVNIINEAQNYIEHLEEKQALLENLLGYINKLNDSLANESKQEILENLKKILPYG